MKKIYFTLCLVAFFHTIGNAQVKIGNNPTTINASSILEIEATNKGLLLPRVALVSTDNAAPLASHVAGMTIYNTATGGSGSTAVSPGYFYNTGTEWKKISSEGTVNLPQTNLTSSTTPSGTSIGQMVYNTNAASGLPVGPTYWNGTNWVPVGGGIVKGSNGITVSNDTIRLGGTISRPTAIGGLTGTNKIQFIGSGTDAFSVDGQTFSVDATNNAVGIGTNAPNISSILDLDVSGYPANGKKGFLGPRVALQSVTDQTTIPSPAVGLLVFNLGTGGLTSPGFMYWNGTQWRYVNNSTAANPVIASLNCSSARLNPPTYLAGTPYFGTLTIPYTGGNGGSYNSGTSIFSTGVTGLTAVLQSGTLDEGSGSLVFNVTGTPSANSPATATFNIPALFGASSCSATVGLGQPTQITQYAQVSFESFVPTTGNETPNGSLATLFSNVGISRVKRISPYVFRVDFTVPFPDDKYIVNGTVQESLPSSTNNIGIYMFANGFTYTLNNAGTAIMGDTDVNPGNPLGLDPRQTFTQAGLTFVQMRYKTHCYIADGFGGIPIIMGSISVTR